MATSGYLRKSMSASYDFFIYWEVTSQNVANNTSTVKLNWGTEKKQANSQTYNLNSHLTAKYENTTAQNATEVQFDMRYSSVGAQKVYYTTTITVNHNADGTKSLYLYGYLNVGSLSGASSQEISGYATLPTIARASGISATSNYIGSTSTITIDKKSSSYTTTVSYKISGQSSFTAIQTKSTATSINWTIPTSCYDYLSSSTKTITITLQCITYSGSTQIGDAVTTAIIATAPSSECKPTVSVTYSFGSDTNNLTGKTNVGILNFSTITIAVTATAKHGATISSRSVTMDGTTKTGSSVSFTKMPTSSFTYSVKDSRGFTTTGTVNVTTIPYIVPTCIVSVSPLDVQTGKATITVKGDFYNGTFKSGGDTNALTVQYQYKLSSASSYTSVTVTPTKSGNKYTATAQVALDSTKIYDIRARVKDSATTSYIYATATRLQTSPIINFGSSNISLNARTFLNEHLYFGERNGDESSQSAVRRIMWQSSGGTYSHKSGMYGGSPTSKNAVGAYDFMNDKHIWRYNDVDNEIVVGDGTDTKIFFNNSLLQNFIISSGTSSGWYWRKYKDGTIEMFSTKSFSGVNASKNHYSGYYYSDAQSMNYPFTISTVITGEISGGSTNLINFVKPISFSTNKFTYWVCGLDSTATSCSGSIYIHIIGTM